LRCVKVSCGVPNNIWFVSGHMVKVRLLPKLDDVLLVDTDHRVSNPQIKWGGEIEEIKGGYPLSVDANTGQEHLVCRESPQKAWGGVVFWFSADGADRL